ncbi:hypothetical protein AB0D08_23860 [Kitasatospora sp. NPDC048540]|uniref:hypothetical protein n=1 Tax=unclassified Kitasatospora TaxID=2633591 RepID=UPI00053BB798|nr:hypothetical protein [Kitasatospora sp. MBT63]
MITYQHRRLAALADESRWPELLDAYRRTRAAAVARHGQAVGAAEAAPFGHLIAYGAPPELAARLFDPDGGPDTAAGPADHDAGPLWEVLATRHPWRRLAPLLDAAPVRRLVTHTRVLLGEDLTADAEPDPEGVPLTLAGWEAAGRQEGGLVPEYLRDGGALRVPAALPATREGLGQVDLPAPGEPVRGLAATRLLAVLAPWATVSCVRGTGRDAAARTAPPGRVNGGHLPFAAAYPALVRVGSEHPAQGAADGRLALWRVLAAMTGGPRPSRAEIDSLVARLRCFTWSEPADEVRYLHLTLEDPATGLAWAVSGNADI